MPPIEAMVAVVIAGVIGWFVFRPFFAAGTIPGRKRKISVTARTSSSRSKAVYQAPRNSSITRKNSSGCVKMSAWSAPSTMTS